MKYTGNDNLEIMENAKNYNAFLINTIIKIINSKKNCNILDFGCGTGYFMQQLINRMKSDINMVGIEIDDDSLKKCSNKNLIVYKNINDYNIKFDIIYSLNVLEHIENDVQVLQQMYAKLKENGKILIYVPAYTILWSSMDDKTGHKRRYSKNELLNKIKSVGFLINEINYSDSLGFLVTLLYKLKNFFKKDNGEITLLQILIYDLIIFPLSKFLDNIFLKYIIGKNLLVIATKPML